MSNRKPSHVSSLEHSPFTAPFSHAGLVRISKMPPDAIHSEIAALRLLALHFLASVDPAPVVSGPVPAVSGPVPVVSGPVPDVSGATPCIDQRLRLAMHALARAAGLALERLSSVMAPADIQALRAGIHSANRRAGLPDDL
jgi:hypothetical protein